MAIIATDVALSETALEQMRQVIIESFDESALESAFREAVGSEQHESLDDAMHDWLVRQLSVRNEELLDEIFRFFMVSLLQDFRGHRLQ